MLSPEERERLERIKRETKLHVTKHASYATFNNEVILHTWDFDFLLELIERGEEDERN